MNEIGNTTTATAPAGGIGNIFLQFGTIASGVVKAYGDVRGVIKGTNASSQPTAAETTAKQTNTKWLLIIGGAFGLGLLVWLFTRKG